MNNLISKVTQYLLFLKAIYVHNHIYIRHNVKLCRRGLRI